MVILNVLVLLVLIGFLVYIISIFSEEGDGDGLVLECIDVNNVVSFIYDACYDAFTKNILLEVRRGQDYYNLRNFKFSFFDFSQQSYILDDIPVVGGVKAYKIPSEKNPGNMEVILGVVKDFSAPICGEPRRIFVKYCPDGISEDGISVTISPFEESKVEDFVEIVKYSREDSDILSLDLVEKERIWKSKCESRWECSAWESCVDGFQRRTCDDLKECFIPTGSPETVRNCDGTCTEKWECEWGKCSAGFTKPVCKDKNRCGTKFDLPGPLKCAVGRNKCVPDITCGVWTECAVDYNFLDLVGGVISELDGLKSRVCRDQNQCGIDINEVRSCSIGVDVYTKRIDKCGSSYIGVYDRLDNRLIASVEEGTDDNPYLNINLDTELDSQYCPYCFDGIKSGDEEKVDCGGSCKSCSEKYKKISFSKKGFWDLIGDWIKRSIT